MPLALIRRLNQRRDHASKVNNRPSRPRRPAGALSVNHEAKADAIPARVFPTRPSCSAAPRITSPTTARAKPSAVKLCRMSPTVSPPIVGN